MSLQEDLDRLMRWSDKWLLTFNPAKRLVMHIGHTLETGYYMESGGNRARLKTTAQERDLSVNVTNDLKPSLQGTWSVEKPTSVLFIVRTKFRKLRIKDFDIVYKSYARPHLKYCVQV